MSSIPEVDRAGSRELLCAMRREAYTAARAEELLPLQADGAQAMEVCNFSTRRWFGYALAASAAIAASALVRHSGVLGSPSSVASGLDSFEASAAKLFEDGCTDDPVGWASAGGKTCKDYQEMSWCTRTGGYGSSWDRKAHGSFERYANGGRSAVEACCACGGGRKDLEGAHQGSSTATPTATTSATAEKTTSGQTSRREHHQTSTVSSAAKAEPEEKPKGGSSTTAQSDFVHSMISFGETPRPSKPKGPPPCSWDFKNCTDSQCCRGYGMQCYSKDGVWSACKASCTPGIDPFDKDKIPWSCQKLGDRTPGPGSEETCNRVRVGANFWNGKVLHQGDASSAHLCNRECELRDWCGVWAWNESDTAKGMCLLAPPSSRKRRLNEGRQPPCRFASADLPAQNCSGSGEDCSLSNCCSVQGEQCYKKDDSSAMCRSSCRKDHGWSCDKFGPRICPACRPPTRSRPAVVVPTFERDLCKAIILMKSITKRDPNHFLGDVHVMWVSEEPSWKYASQIDEMRRAIVGTGVRQFHLLDFSEPVRQKRNMCLVWTKDGKNCITHVTGWFAQQALKLKISKLVSSEYYLLLDSKNAFFSEIHEDSFFSNCNQAIVHGKYRYEDIPDPHNKWYAASSEALGVKAVRDIYWPTSITPAVLHRQTVLELLSQIGEDPNPYSICDGPLCTWFGQGKTEFTMYNLFAFSKADRECIHSFMNPLNEAKESNVALWRGSPYINLERCEEVATGNVKALTFGLQADCLQRNNMTNHKGKLSHKDKDWLWSRTSDCLFRIYEDAGLADGSSRKVDKDHEEFAKCIS